MHGGDWVWLEEAGLLVLLLRALTQGRWHMGGCSLSRSHAQVASAPLLQVLPGTSPHCCGDKGFLQAPEAQLGPVWAPSHPMLPPPRMTFMCDTQIGQP